MVADAKCRNTKRVSHKMVVVLLISDWMKRWHKFALSQLGSVVIHKNVLLLAKWFYSIVTQYTQLGMYIVPVYFWWEGWIGQRKFPAQDKVQKKLCKASHTKDIWSKSKNFLHNLTLLAQKNPPPFKIMVHPIA